MVTTIKITCDGVFIQSETYNVHNATVAKYETASVKKVQSEAKTHLRSELSIKNHKLNDNIISTSTSTTKTTTPDLEVETTFINRLPKQINNGLSCKIKNDCRNRYYFGSNNTYLCNEKEHSLLAGKTTVDMSSINIRSSCNLIHKELQENSLNLLIENATGKIRCKDFKKTDKINNNNINNHHHSHHRHKCNMTIDVGAKHEFVHYCEKYREPSQFVCSKSIVLAKNSFKRNNSFSNMNDKMRHSPVKSCKSFNDQSLNNNNNTKLQSDTRLKSFFRSARHFYRTSSERSITTSVLDAKANDKGSIMILKRRTHIIDTIIENLPITKEKSTIFYDDWFDEDAVLTVNSLKAGEDNDEEEEELKEKNAKNEQITVNELKSNKQKHKQAVKLNKTQKEIKTEISSKKIIKTGDKLNKKSVLNENKQVTQFKEVEKTINTEKRENQVMNTHVSASQGGQTSVVGHHRGFSQSSLTVATNSASTGDPWFLQTSGHQMPPTAPLRHNKRPAPQPLSSVSNAAGAALAGIGAIGVTGSGSTALLNTTGTAIGGVVASTLQLQQQLSQSQPHIVASSLLSTQLHHNNMNPHHSANASLHLSSHALNSHNLINTTIGNNHATNNQQQQQQQQQQQHLLTTFLPQTAPTATLNNANVIPVVVATTQHQLLTTATTASASNNNSNLMTTSLTLHERNLPPKSINMVSGMHGGSQMLLTSSSNMQMHHQLSQPQQQHQQQQTTTVNSTTPIGGNMSTSLHSFDINGSSNATTAWVSGTNTALSPTTTGLVPTLINNHQHPPQQQQQQQHMHQSHRKCEVKLNAMPWFHGSITRDEAEHLLQPREDGLFLVRESTNFPGDYTLCVCFQGKVEHYRVKYLENKLTIDDEEYFENLSQLVAHYEADADGLCTQLTKCLPKAGAQEFCINSKDFIDKGWVIPEADLQLRESIGKGEFGDVLLGILRNEKVAVKMLKDEGAVQKFLAEASVMTTLEHENLVKFIGLVFTSKHIYLVTEYMSKGSLVDYLRSRGRQHITKKDQINFAYDTASGMEYLEAKKVVHRDLAARNVLISEECVAKVSDFGLARGECYNLDVGKLPIKWTAPEALKNGRFSNKSDMWSFGILLWEIYSFGRVPYPRIPLNDVVKHVEVGYKMEAPEGCPAEIYEMMRQAWDLNPAKRPSFAELKVKLLHLKNTTA